MVLVSKGQGTENLSVVTLLLRLCCTMGHRPVRAKKLFVV